MKLLPAPCSLDYPGCQKFIERASWLVLRAERGQLKFSCSACKAEKARQLQKKRYYAKSYELDKNTNQKLAIMRARDEDLEKYPKKDWSQLRKYLLTTT